MHAFLLTEIVTQFGMICLMRRIYLLLLLYWPNIDTVRAAYVTTSGYSFQLESFILGVGVHLNTLLTDMYKCCTIEGKTGMRHYTRKRASRGRERIPCHHQMVLRRDTFRKVIGNCIVLLMPVLFSSNYLSLPYLLYTVATL